MKHTPGPWKTLVLPSGKRYVADYDMKRIAYLPDLPDEYGTAANATLIAAAPELLEVCEALLGILTPRQYTKQFPNVYRKAKEVIAKAKGRKENEQ